MTERPRQHSISQIKALGDRLARSKEASPADREMLRDVIATAAEQMVLVQDRIRRALGVSSTARPKTEKTTIEKIRRDRTRLNKMDDLAGVRIVVQGGLPEQDSLVGQLLDLFPGAKVRDHRAGTSTGYRAVHVIPTVGDRPVEIQVRTPLQHAWADLFEQLADATDRNIRYGAVPRDKRARELYEIHVRAASAIKGGEEAEAQVSKVLIEQRRNFQELLAFRPIPPKGDPARRRRDNAIRRVRAQLRGADDARVDFDTAARRLSETLAQAATNIREGRTSFERGAVD